MNVEIINQTKKPEEVVVKAARNDYRTEGVIGNSFSEIVNAIKPKDEYKNTNLSDEEAKKRTLIDKLMSDQHWGPFEHPQAVISLEGVTRVSMAQITRHRHFSFDVMSLRYVEIDSDNPDDVIKKPHNLTNDKIKGKSKLYEPDISPERRKEIWYETVEQQLDAYQELIDGDYPQEEARKLLGMGTKVNMVMSSNARGWMHLLNIRGKANVQGEAREIINKIKSECKTWMPHTFNKYDKMLPLNLTP